MTAKDSDSVTSACRAGIFPGGHPRHSRRHSDFRRTHQLPSFTSMLLPLTASSHLRARSCASPGATSNFCWMFGRTMSISCSSGKAKSTGRRLTRCSAGRTPASVLISSLSVVNGRLFCPAPRDPAGAASAPWSARRRGSRRRRRRRSWSGRVRRRCRTAIAGRGSLP